LNKARGLVGNEILNLRLDSREAYQQRTSEGIAYMFTFWLGRFPAVFAFWHDFSFFWLSHIPTFGKNPLSLFTYTGSPA
jgi:hypothetical protein